jgi:ferredoxin
VSTLDGTDEEVAVKVVVDRVKCTGLGICEAKAPNVFEIDEDGALLVLDENVAPDQVTQVKAAADACPTRALSLVED